MNSTRRGTLAAALAAVLVATTGAAAEAKPPKRPDLVVNSIAVVSGAPHPGAILTIRDATTNIGSALAKQSSTALYLSKDGKRDKGDTKLGRRTLMRLKAGTSSAGLSAVKLPKGAKPGSYRLIACADARQAVSEKNEANNCATKPVAVTPAPGNPGGNAGAGKLAYLKLFPPTATIGYGPGILLPWGVFVQDLDTTVTYYVEGYDASGHGLGDFTNKAKFDLDGACTDATCYVTAEGTQTVTASVGTAKGTASVTGVPARLVCPGERYDVDNDGQDCDEIQSFQGHTAARHAKSLGAKPCYDGAFDSSFQGTMLSDSRQHLYPGVEGFDYDVGSAPAWRSLQAIGGQCANDIKLTVQTTGGGSQKCYRVSMNFSHGLGQFGEPAFYKIYRLDVAGNETKTLTRGPGSYDDNTTLYFEIEKICPASVREKVSYTVNYHL